MFFYASLGLTKEKGSKKLSDFITDKLEKDYCQLKKL